jgi:hypothetical protein
MAEMAKKPNRNNRASKLRFPNALEVVVANWIDDLAGRRGRELGQLVSLV